MRQKLKGIAWGGGGFWKCFEVIENFWQKVLCLQYGNGNKKLGEVFQVLV